MPKAPNRKRLTLAEMKGLIESGQSVIHNGEMITTVEGLPTEVDLALGDPVKEDATAADIDLQIAALQSQKARLGKPREALKEEDPTKPPVDPKDAQRKAILDPKAPAGDPTKPPGK